MVAECFHQDIVHNKHLLWQCMLTLSHFIAVAAVSKEKLRRHVGGEVVFRCPFEPDVKYNLLYLMKGKDFVNGYYGSVNMSVHNPWPNSRVDKENNRIYMSKLNVSHAGLYTCQIETSKGLDKETNIELTITANYSTPSIQLHNCTDKKDQCLVQCSSHGGYPKNKIMWNITAWEGPPIALMWRNESAEEDSNTQLFNLSSMASVNCSTGKQQNISCSVDGVSPILSVCKQESNAVIVPIICVVIILALAVKVAVAGFCAYKKCRSRASPYMETNQDEIGL